MKKKKLSNLSLKKNTISNLATSNSVVGKGTSGCEVTDYRYCSAVNCNPLTITTCNESTPQKGCHTTLITCFCPAI
jgi:hypothetical protein